jgi:hypothetical protein
MHKDALEFLTLRRVFVDDQRIAKPAQVEVILHQGRDRDAEFT